MRTLFKKKLWLYVLVFGVVAGLLIPREQVQASETCIEIEDNVKLMQEIHSNIIRNHVAYIDENGFFVY